MICLDTNVVIGLLNGRNPRMRERFEAQIAQRAELTLPAISLFEMSFGHAKSRRKAEADRRLDDLLARGVAVIPFEADDAAHAGDIRAILEAEGKPIGAYDLLIAAQARRRGAT